MSRVPVIERDLPAVADWLDHFVAAAPGRNPIPILGSPGWIEAGDDIRIASLARYALGTLGELDPAVIAARLVAEIEAGRRDQAIITRQASKAISADWGNLARHPSHVEMVRRRGIPATPRRCGHPRCTAVVTVDHPLPADLGQVRCGRHRPGGDHGVSPYVSTDISGHLLAVHHAYNRWFGDKYDIGALDCVLCAAAAEKLGGDPPWLLVVAGSGTAKTETINPLIAAGAVGISTINGEAALLSGTSRKEKSKDATRGLLRTVGDSGIVVIKDVTSILSMNRDTRALVLAALREIYDGRWSRNVGTDGGRTLAWSGRIVIIGAVTTAWDSAHAVIGHG